MLTAFDYLYRDAGNFKAFGSVLLDGPVTNADEELVRQHLDGSEYFIAEQVGVPPLYDQLYGWSDGPTASDHCWHEFVGFREFSTASRTDVAVVPAGEFVARFAQVTNWDEGLSPHFWLADPLRP